MHFKYLGWTQLKHFIARTLHDAEKGTQTHFNLHQ